MKILTPVLNDFIEDYKIDTSNVSICFNATVYVISAKQSDICTAEVRIVCIPEKNIDVIYLLDLSKDIPGMPTDFSDSGNFYYSAGKSLVIKSFSYAQDKFYISIYPQNSKCMPESIEELELRYNINS